jgi:hypothetical protein
MDRTRREVLTGAAAVAAVPLPVATSRVFREPTAAIAATDVHSVRVYYMFDRIGHELDREMCALSGLTDGRFEAVANG